MIKECGTCDYFEPDDPTKPNGWAALDGICGWDIAEPMPVWAETALDRAYKQISSSDRYCPCWKEAHPSRGLR